MRSCAVIETHHVNKVSLYTIYVLYVLCTRCRVWRYRGGRDRCETLQQYMKFLGREVQQNSGELAGWCKSSLQGDIHVCMYVV